ncbi:MAG: hypothetical protein AAB378_01810 [Patescibacteria group bacterium]
MNKRKVGVAGLGFVGRQVANWFLSRGWRQGRDLFLYDANQDPCLKDDLQEAKIVFVCVPTPSRKDGRCDASIVESVVAQFRNVGPWDKIVVIKSTVEPGTTNALEKKYNVAILFNPEFLTEARAEQDFVNPDRQIVGFTERSQPYARMVLDLLPLAKFESPGADRSPIQITAFEAELIKYFANMFGASKVSFANAMNIVAEATGADYNQIRQAVSADGRIGESWMDVNHGSYRGFGGYCFPKDSRALIAWINDLYEAKRAAGEDAELIKAACNLLYASYYFNEILLGFQGLVWEDVSGHIKKGGQ